MLAATVVARRMWKRGWRARNIPSNARAAGTITVAPVTCTSVAVAALWCRAQRTGMPVYASVVRSSKTIPSVRCIGADRAATRCAVRPMGTPHYAGSVRRGIMIALVCRDGAMCVVSLLSASYVPRMHSCVAPATRGLDWCHSLAESVIVVARVGIIVNAGSGDSNVSVAGFGVLHRRIQGGDSNVRGARSMCRRCKLARCNGDQELVTKRMIVSGVNDVKRDTHVRRIQNSQFVS